MYKFIIAAAVFISQYAFSQDIRNMGDFSSLKVYDQIRVELIQSNENKVEVQSQNSANVETVNKNGELKIRMSTSKVMQGNTTKVKVYFVDLNEIQASQGAVIQSDDMIKGGQLSITSNEGSEVSLDIETKNLHAKTNSGGILKLTGTATNQDAVVNSGAKYLCKELKSENATVSTNAGGTIEVYASESVSATTRAGGVINVFGDPSERKTKNFIGGKVIFD